MSKENAIKFLRELRTNEKAKELLQGRERPKNREDAIKAYAEVAAELGEDISPEDFAEALEEIEAEIHQKTEAVSANMIDLEDDDLEGVAGGFYTFVNGEKVYDQCLYTFNNTTTCGSRDACEIQDIYYYDCPGKVHANGAEEYCWFDLN
jgi:hypothetical protein